MKNLFSVLVMIIMFLSSCSGPSVNNSSNGTHTHSDGTVHSGADGHEHAPEDAPDGQETFKVEGAEAQHSHEDHQHTEDCEEHDHQH